MPPDQDLTAPADPLPEPAPVASPPRVSEVFWGYADLAWLVGIVFGGLVLINLAGFAAITLRRGLRDSGPFLLLLQFALYGMIYGGFYFVFQARYGQPVMRSLGWRRSRFGLAAAALTGVALAVAVQALALALHTPEENPVEPFTKTPLSLTLVIVMAVAAAPLFEELLFRGFVQPLLTRDLGAVAGVTLTGVLFGWLHVFEYGNHWQYGLAISLVGIVLGYIRLRTNSTMATTMVHACFNSISVAGLLASKFGQHS